MLELIRSATFDRWLSGLRDAKPQLGSKFGSTVSRSETPAMSSLSVAASPS